MKKLFILFLTLVFPVSVMAQSLPELEARSIAVGGPNYVEWCLSGNVFWAGYEGFVDFMDNYLTPENRQTVIDAKAYSPKKLNNLLYGTGQSVGEWLEVNPWNN